MIRPSAAAQVQVERAGPSQDTAPVSPPVVQLLNKEQDKEQSCQQRALTPSTYITVGSASITAALLPQGLPREGTG